MTDTVVTELRDAGATAERERRRLEASAGRSRVVALLRRVPIALRAATTASAATTGLRYQPVAWTLIAVVAVAWFFPGRDDGRAGAEVAAPATPFTTPTTVPAVIAPSTPATTPVRPVALPRPAASPVTSVDSPTSPPPVQPSSAPATPEADPLQVRGAGWASRLSGTGLSTVDVPEGALPVSNRLGQLDKASFVRLRGSSTVLRLTEVDDGAREALGAGLVVACPITEAGWQEAPDQSLDEAPPWDATACVAGVEDDGVWSFDLSAFDADGDAGFALVPDASAPPDFQVTFESAS